MTPRSGEATSALFYEIPDIRKLEDSYQLYDMHLHTTLSDGATPPAEAANRAAELGIGLAITDHNQIKGSLEALSYGRCPIIPAIEVASRKGLDTLAYFEEPDDLIRFFEKEVKSHRGIDPSSFTDLDVFDIMRAVIDYGGFPVIAHPFMIGWKSWKRVISNHTHKLRELTAGIECCNGGLSYNRNKEALELALSWKKTVIGGSDSHILKTLGDVLTLIPAELAGDPIGALRRSQTIVVGRQSKAAIRIYGHSRMIVKHAKYWPTIVTRKVLDFQNGKKK